MGARPDCSSGGGGSSADFQPQRLSLALLLLSVEPLCFSLLERVELLSHLDRGLPRSFRRP